MPFISKWASCVQANRSWLSLILSLFIHMGCCLFCRLKLLGNSVFYGCERSRSDGSSLRSPRGACWSSFKRVALYITQNHTDGSTIYPWIQWWWITLQAYIFPWGRCRPDVLRWFKCWKPLKKKRIIHGVCRGIGWARWNIKAWWKEKLPFLVNFISLYKTAFRFIFIFMEDMWLVLRI